MANRLTRPAAPVMLKLQFKVMGFHRTTAQPSKGEADDSYDSAHEMTT